MSQFEDLKINITQHFQINSSSNFQILISDFLIFNFDF